MLLLKYIKYQLMVIMQKVPGINLYQIAEVETGKFLVMIPKAGTRSIRDALATQKSGALNLGGGIARRNLKTVEYYKFMTLRKVKRIAKFNEVYAVNRGWEERLQSCWRQKVKSPESYFYFWQYYPLLYPNMEYGKFRARVMKIPERLREKHFMEYSELYEIPQLKIIELSDLDDFLMAQFGKTFRSNTTNG